MIDLDDLLTLPEAAELLGRTPEALKKAAQRGRLLARRLGSGGQRALWITTRQAVAEYRAGVIENERPGRYRDRRRASERAFREVLARRT